MSVAEDFTAFLKANGPVSTLVGAQVCQAPAHSNWRAPYVVFRRSGRREPLSLDGEGGMVETDFDVECRGDNTDEAEDLADAVHAALNGYRGTWPSDGTDDRVICGVFVEDQDDDYEYLPPGANDAEATSTLYVKVYSR